MTQTALAKRMGVTQSMISQIETRAEGMIMTYEFALNAALILGCKMEDFYTHELTLERSKG